MKKNRIQNYIRFHVKWSRKSPANWTARKVSETSIHANIAQLVPTYSDDRRKNGVHVELKISNHILKVEKSHLLITDSAVLDALVKDEKNWLKSFRNFRPGLHHFRHK